MVVAPDPLAVESSRRAYHLLQLASVIAPLVLFLSLMSAHEVVHGGLERKLFLILRVAFLVLLCTWFLRRDGERWADVGLRWPRRWWLVPLLVVGGFVLVLVLNEAIRNALLPAIGASPPQMAPREALAGDVPEYRFALLSA